MSDVLPKSKGTGRIFESPVLEKLTRTHISVPLVLFTSFAAALLYWSVETTSLTAGMTTFLFFLGWLSFSLVEYLMHRYVFHMNAYTEARKMLQYKIHGVHHEYPKDKDRLAMPPLLSVTIASVLLLFFRLIMGDLVFAFLPGFLVGYTSYLAVHYMVHAFQPPRNFLKALWVHHAVHHYKEGEKAFGVSSPLWDHVFRTMP